MIHKKLVSISSLQRELGGRGAGWEGNIFSTVGAPELYTHHFLNIFPKYPPAPSVHQVPSCVQHRPSPVPSSSFCFPIGNTACPLRSWARLLVVLSSLYLPYQSPPRACQYSVPPACSHSLPQPLLSVPTVPAPAQASSTPASWPPPVSPLTCISQKAHRGLSDIQI